MHDLRRPRQKKPAAPARDRLLSGIRFRLGNGMASAVPVKMGSVMAPIVMSAASAPAVVMAVPSATHMTAAVSMTAADLDHRIVLRGHRGHAQSGRSGRRQCKC